MSQQNLNNPNNLPPRIIWFGDLVTPSGFGRIGNEITTRLAQSGKVQVMGLSMQWNGYPPNPLPYPVIPVPGPNWPMAVQIVQQQQPDVVVVCQDFPYAQFMYQGSRLDWSRMKLMVITPIDGTPIHPDWVDLAGLADSVQVISEFGVEGLRQAGQPVGLLPPGVDTGEFYPALDGEVDRLRETLGIAPDAFVVGMFAMNQGRKCISATVEVFLEFARDKPDAVLYLDMEKGSPAGWDIPALCKTLDPAARVLRVGETVRFKEDAFAKGMTGLRDRYLLCDVNSVVSHREGFGLPLIEAQACGIVAMALDWCSGPEIVGEGRGCLVRAIEYREHGTWGFARDAFPDRRNWLAQLNRLHDDPVWRAGLAARGYQAATARTWDAAYAAFNEALRRVLNEQQKERQYEPDVPFTIPSPGFSDDGAATDRPIVQPGGPGLPEFRPVLQPGLAFAGIAELSNLNRPPDDGNPGGGRLQPRRGPDPDPAAARPDGPPPGYELGLCEQLQRGRRDGAGQDAGVLQSGPAGPATRLGGGDGGGATAYPGWFGWSETDL